MNQEHKKDNFMRNLFISLIVIVIILLGFNYWQQKSTEAPEGDVPATAASPLRSDDHIIGKSNAKVTLVEYADLQCPACKAFEPILTKLAATHANDDFAYVYRYFPLVNIHSHALLAAHYNEAAGIQGKFWEMNHMLYQKQDEWAEALDAEDKIKGYAATLGLDVTKLSTDANSQSVSDKVANSLKEANKLGLNSTPSLLLNGVKITVKNEQDLRDLIARAIANSKGNMATSTSSTTTFKNK